MTPKQIFNENLVKIVIKNLEKRKMQGFYCETKQDALNKVLELIPENSEITFGGSQSINEIGLINKLKNGNYKVFDRSYAKNQDEIDEIYRKAYFSDFYICSSNAISQDGVLINIDGTGNRVSAMIYGPKNVILVVGINKITKDIESGIERVRNYSAPLNTIRLDRKTPCKTTSKCHNCLSEDCICCQIVLTRVSRYENRIKVIIVGEELGY